MPFGRVVMLSSCVGSCAGGGVATVANVRTPRPARRGDSDGRIRVVALAIRAVLNIVACGVPGTLLSSGHAVVSSRLSDKSRLSIINLRFSVGHGQSRQDPNLGPTGKVDIGLTLYRSKCSSWGQTASGVLKTAHCIANIGLDRRLVRSGIFSMFFTAREIRMDAVGTLYYYLEERDNPQHDRDH